MRPVQSSANRLRGPSVGGLLGRVVGPSPRGANLQAEQLRRILAMTEDVVAQLDLPDVLSRVLECARELTGARYGAIGVLDRDRRELEQFLTSGMDETARELIGDLPRGRGVLGALIDAPQPLRLDDVGSHPHSYGFPQGHPPMTTFLGMPITVSGEAWGNLYLTDKHGGEPFTDADEEALQMLARWAGVAVANAEAYLGEHDRRRELEQAVAGLEATTAIAQALGGETDLDVILELVVKRGRSLVGARGVLIMLRDGEDLVVRAQAGALAPMAGLRVPVEGSVSGHVLQQRRSERLGDLPSRLHFAMASTVDAATALFVPMLFRGQRLGVLCAFDRIAGGEFGRDDQRLLEAFAASAAMAVTTAQSVASRELHRSIEAAESERRRWARELHDETLQDLAALRLTVGAVRNLPSLPEPATAALDEILEHLNGSVTGLRHLISELRPAALDDLGVGPALDALVRRVAGSSDADIGVDVRLRTEGEGSATRLVPAVEETLYRLVQECLTNVGKHAPEATSVQVRVVEDEHVVEVSVHDDGAGFEVGTTSAGFGLVGMRERVSLTGGTLDVRSASGEGTTVRAVLPARRLEPPPAPVVAAERLRGKTA
jgi:signal transduction histidine kinase